MVAFVSGCGPDPDSRLGSSSSALTDAQCIYFEANGTDTICHATGSSKHPYVLLRFSEAACINNHAGHGQDFVDFTGGDCNNAACLPVGAPCDATLGCCSGTCNSAICSCSAAGGGCATASDCCAGICYQDTCCTPLTACSAGACGTISDGCGGTIDCGACVPGQTCVNNQCVCVPSTACPAGTNCGTISDGCGGTINCGTCQVPSNASTVSCTAGACVAVYKGTITAVDLTAKTITLGSLTIEWNAQTVITIGGASATIGDLHVGLSVEVNAVPQPDGSLLALEIDSVCTPATACPAGTNCGTISDGCGGTINCGTCAAGQTCTNNQCTGSSYSCTSDSECAQGETCDAMTGVCQGAPTGGCHQCACVDLLSSGGCADVCDQAQNGNPNTPNFCNGVAALPQCAACLTDRCAGSNPNDPSSCM
jgi:hypothetical protein